MCESVYYVNGGRDIHYPFSDLRAVLPIQAKSGVILLPWGRRKQESGKLPFGGWAHLDTIKSGKWERFFPRAVKLNIRSFMSHDVEGTEHWYDVTKGQIIQGLVAHIGQERRVYIVTVAPQRDDSIHEKWPRIISAI